MLVITNSEAGTSDQRRLEEALAVLRTAASVEVAATSNPGELDGVLHRAGSRLIVVAGGDGSLHAVVAALHKRNELKGRTLALLPMGSPAMLWRAVLWGVALGLLLAPSVLDHVRDR